MKRREIKKIVKILIFIIIANLPFITAANILSVDTFLDSFENPEFYISVKNDNKIIKTDFKEGDYLIIQRANHPDFKIKDKDEIIYVKDEGDIVCNQVLESKSIGSIKMYYTKEDNKKDKNEPIYETQIVGKIIKSIDDNLWNSISMEIWKISINDLNINAMLKK